MADHVSCPDSVRNSSNFLSHDDFIVETLTPHHGWRAIERRGEPELFTKSSARDVAEAWAVSFNVETRVRSLDTGEVIDTDTMSDMFDTLEAIVPRPSLDDLERDIEAFLRRERALDAKRIASASIFAHDTATRVYRDAGLVWG